MSDPNINQTHFDRAVNLLAKIASGEIAGAAAAAKAAEALDGLEIASPAVTIYHGTMKEWNPERAPAAYPVAIERGPDGDLAIVIGAEGDTAAKSMRLLVEVNMGRPCVHVYPSVDAEDTALAVFAESPEEEHPLVAIRIEGDQQVRPVENWEGTHWSVLQVRST